MTDRALGLLLSILLYGGTLLWMGETQGWSWAMAGAAVFMTAIFAILFWIAALIFSWCVQSFLELLGAAGDLAAWVRGKPRSDQPPP